MTEKTDSPRTPTPEQEEGLKCAAAFAYGYCQAIYDTTFQPIYLERAKGLKQELIDKGCFDACGQLNQPYFAHRLRGLAKAGMELAKVGLS